MIARALGAVALAASLGFAAPGVAPAPAAATGIASDHAPVVQRVEDAVLRATYANVPGASGSGWVLTDLQRSATGIGGMEFVVAKGVLTNAGAPDIELRLTGRFDPDTGELARVAYKLQAATPALPAASQGWSVQQAVEDAFAQVLTEPARWCGTGWVPLPADRFARPASTRTCQHRKIGLRSDHLLCLKTHFAALARQL